MYILAKDKEEIDRNRFTYGIIKVTSQISWKTKHCLINSGRKLVKDMRGKIIYNITT